MKLKTLNETTSKQSSKAPTLLTAREQEAVAAAGCAPGGVIWKNHSGC